jgi:hypothetical protein
VVGSALIPEESLIVGAARQLIEDRADVANVAAVVLTPTARRLRESTSA